MNLSQLFETQRTLDEHINAKHPIQAGEEVWSKKVLALLIEVGELVNELPEVFKRWSNKKNKMDKALEEYVDALHFFLSLGLDIGVDKDQSPREYAYASVPVRAVDFIRLKDAIIYMWYGKSQNTWWNAFDMFCQIGYSLCFTGAEIEQAYVQKNSENHERQNNGY